MFKWIKEKLGLDEKEKTQQELLEEKTDKNIEAEKTDEDFQKENLEFEKEFKTDKEDDKLSKSEEIKTDLEEIEEHEVQKESEKLDSTEEENIEYRKEFKDNEEDEKLSESEEVKNDFKEIEEHEIQEDKYIDSLEEENKEYKEEFKKSQEEIEQVEEENKRPSFFERLKTGLTKTRKEVGIKINTVLGNYVKIDDEMLEDLEDILISADIGMNTTMKLIDNLRDTIIQEKINDPTKVKPLLMEEAKKLMNPDLNSSLTTESPTIILIVGVNGVGKTTTIGKLSQRFKKEGKSVLVCAADTFRAAAIDQLKEWGNRANVDIISHAEGSDPAAVVFDAIAAAKARGNDILIIDTAGRLHNKSNLMKELEKINKIINKNYPEANRETLLVLDATTGQNAMNQAKTFKEASEITGIALTKLDGTAKGGVVIALQSELGIPIKLIGVGEGIDDLQDFNLNNFIEAIFE